VHGSDVVIILQKQRVKLETLEITVRGTRREPSRAAIPRSRFISPCTGRGGRREGAAAIDLSLEKYCSVVASLAPDIAISYDVAIA